MEDFLRGIYKVGAFKTNLELTVDACHRIDGQDVKKFFNGNDAVFSDFVNEYAKLDPEGANRLITDAGIVVNNQGDMLKFGDLIEERLLPPLKKFLEYNATIDVDVDENGMTFSDNSMIKARAVANCLADKGDARDGVCPHQRHAPHGLSAHQRHAAAV